MPVEQIADLLAAERRALGLIELSGERMQVLCITLTRAPGFQYSNLDVYAEADIPSLRRAAGSPKAITSSGDLRVVHDLEAALADLQAGRALAALKSKLPLHGVSLSKLRTDWQRLIKSLKGVRVSRTLTAEYRFLGRSYEVPVAGGIDAASGLVCIAADADRLNEFYAVLASHIFRPDASDAWGLMRAARDRRQLNLFEVVNEESDDELEDAGDEEADDDSVGDVHEGHGLSKAKLQPVVPNPGPIGEITSATPIARKRRKSRTPAPSAGDAERHSIEEEEQKRALKHDHYGFHCQVCIGEMEVLKAAPPGTYVFAPGYRERLLQAHHAKQMQNQGIVGGKNLLILCEYHHRLRGDELSRDKVLSALASAETVRRHFPRDATGKDLERREGLLAIVPLDSEPFSVRLYFTKQHAAAWQGKT